MSQVGHVGGARPKKMRCDVGESDNVEPQEGHEALGPYTRICAEESQRRWRETLDQPSLKLSQSAEPNANLLADPRFGWSWHRSPL